jgi:predicted nucleic acid-binding protein
MRVLIDTNILISASLNRDGAPYQAFIKAVTYPNHGMVCDQNIDEFRRVYNRKFPHKIQALERILAIVLTVLEVVQLTCQMKHLYGTNPIGQYSGRLLLQKLT